MAWTLGELAENHQGRLVGDPDLLVHPVPAGATDPAGIAFCENRTYLAQATGVGALLLPYRLSSPDKPYIQVSDPRSVFTRLLGELERPIPLAAGIHPTAVVDDDTDIDPTASIGPYAVVERGAVLGSGVRVHAAAYVGENCRIGADTVIHPHAILCQNVRIGERCAIHPGAVVGSEGFGFADRADGWERVPQIGGVRIGDDVDLRALASVERATCGTTEVADGAKIGGLAYIAHNARIGEHALMVPTAAIGGSSSLGRRSTMGGQSLVTDHVAIGDDVRLGARSATTRGIDTPGVYTGWPARPLAQHLRIQALLPSLPGLLDRVQQLERQLERLQQGQDDQRPDHRTERRQDQAEQQHDPAGQQYNPAEQQQDPAEQPYSPAEHRYSLAGQHHGPAGQRHPGAGE